MDPLPNVQAHAGHSGICFKAHTQWLLKSFAQRYQMISS